MYGLTRGASGQVHRLLRYSTQVQADNISDKRSATKEEENK